MPNHSEEYTDLVFICDLMREAVKVMEEFPANCVPPDVPIPECEPPITTGHVSAISVAEILSDPQVQNWLRRSMDSWPKNFMPIFVQASGILAQILEMFGARRAGGIMDVLTAGMTDPVTMQLFMALSHINSESAKLRAEDDNGEEFDPMGMKQALLDELHRREVAQRVPFARTLTTLLGQDALLWLTSGSQEGVGKIQPHEFSRTGWRKIWTIENQLAIEQELLKLEPEAEYLGKIIVAMSWTLAGLASFIPPAVFLGERTPHLSSSREGKLTVSFGTGTHTLISFQPSTMLALVSILAEGLLNPLLSAADLMWIGAGVARVREVQSGLGAAVPGMEEQFSLFLSHRGRDAKLSLSEIVQTFQAAHGVFLDCLTLPRGVVNRSFVYGSLARSKQILIVETENFQESAWCRKEAWFADALAVHGLAKTERLSLPQATERVIAEGPKSCRQRAQQELQYWIAPRVLRDIVYWARTPNLYSLKEAGHSIESLLPLQSVLEKAACPDDPDWVRSIGEAVAETLSEVATTVPDAEQFDLWATALQYSLAAFGSTSKALSKMVVRQGVDQMNAVLKSVVTSHLHTDPHFRAQASNYLALIAAASVIDLAGFALDPRMTPALWIALGDAAWLYDGLLLLDVREAGASRAFRLNFIAILVQANLGSVGILQNASDEVHQGRVGELPLEILPCVTLYPGMESSFNSAPYH